MRFSRTYRRERHRSADAPLRISGREIRGLTVARVRPVSTAAAARAIVRFAAPRWPLGAGWREQVILVSEQANDRIAG
jgi:hypothetical protein